MKALLARTAYSTLLSLLMPAYLLRLWRRGRRERPYRHAIGERLGFYAGVRSSGWLWVHAVSLGETRAAGTLIDTLRRQHPTLKLLLTHSTATGREAGEALLHMGDRQAWLPYDTPQAVRRFFAQFNPRVGVLMETEVWPNLLLAARQAGVPMVLANARLSEKSRHRGEQLQALLRPAVQGLTLVLAQTDDDAARLRSLGARDIHVCGNIKFDMAPDSTQLAAGHAWRALLGRPVVLAASTRDGEEALLLDAWCRLPAPRPLLVVVPRHPQRFDGVASLLNARGLSLARRSTWTDTPAADALQADAWLGDSMGEMPLYYALADAALLGGSFLPLGGQNLIEAAACGCPVVMGEHTFNFSEAANLSVAAGAAIRVDDAGSGVARAMALARDVAEHERWARRAQRFADAHRGAAQCMAEHIAPYLSTPVPPRP